jgi:hypothetical protein
MLDLESRRDLNFWSADEERAHHLELKLETFWWARERVELGAEGIRWSFVCGLRINCTGAIYRSLLERGYCAMKRFLLKEIYTRHLVW